MVNIITDVGAPYVGSPPGPAPRNSAHHQVFTTPIAAIRSKSWSLIKSSFGWLQNQLVWNMLGKWKWRDMECMSQHSPFEVFVRHFNIFTAQLKLLCSCAAEASSTKCICWSVFCFFTCHISMKIYGSTYDQHRKSMSRNSSTFSCFGTTKSAPPV